MPTYKVTAPDGRTVRLTGDSPPTDAELTKIFAELPPKAPAAPAESVLTMGRRSAAMGQNEPGPDPSYADALRHPSPGQQLAIDALPLTASIGEAGIGAMKGAGRAAGNTGSIIARGAVRAGAAAADVVSPEVVGIVSPRAANVLRVVTRLREAMTKAQGEKPSPPPKLADVVDAIQTAPTEAPAAAGTATAEPGDIALPAAGKSPQQTASEEAISRWRAEGKSLNPVPLNQAVASVRAAATTDNVKLTAEEFSAAVKLRAAGKTDTDILDGIQAMRQLKAMGAKGTAEMRADMGQRARAGQKSLMPEYGDEPAPTKTGNPFR